MMSRCQEAWLTAQHYQTIGRGQHKNNTTLSDPPLQKWKNSVSPGFNVICKWYSTL